MHSYIFPSPASCGIGTVAKHWQLLPGCTTGCLPVKYSMHTALQLTVCSPLPLLLASHLPKKFDNIHNLEFKKDAAGNPTKVAVGMYSGEGEYVPFAADCLCDGPVEVRCVLGWGVGVGWGLRCLCCK